MKSFIFSLLFAVLGLLQLCNAYMQQESNQPNIVFNALSLGLVFFFMLFTLSNTQSSQCSNTQENK